MRNKANARNEKLTLAKVVKKNGKHNKNTDFYVIFLS